MVKWLFREVAGDIRKQSGSMDLMRDLVGGAGGGSCAADGTAAAVNPISSLVNTLVRGKDMMASKRSGEEICGLMPQDSGCDPSSLELEMARGIEWINSHPSGQMQPMPPGIRPNQTGLRRPLCRHHSSSFSPLTAGPQYDTTWATLSERESDSWACEFPGHITAVGPPPLRHTHHPHTMPVAWNQACLECSRIAEGGRGAFMPHPISVVGPPWMAPVPPYTGACFPPPPPHSWPFSSPAFLHRPILPHHMGAIPEYPTVNQELQQDEVNNDQHVHDQLEGNQMGADEENAIATEDTGSQAHGWAGQDGIDGHVARRRDEDRSSTLMSEGITSAPLEPYEVVLSTSLFLAS